MKQMMMILCAGMLLSACKKNDVSRNAVLVVSDSFESGANGWEAGFADYNAGEETRFELESGIRNAPAPLDQSNKAYFISGRNLSDDLFMYLKKKITGLQPNTTYRAEFRFGLASNAPSGAVGIGGAPGESVYLGIGVVKQEPVAKGEDMTINIDKGNQATDGPDRKIIGNIANGTSNDAYVLLQKQGSFDFTTGSNGTVWAMVSTDSGFEGTTSLYYTNIEIKIFRR